MFKEISISPTVFESILSDDASLYKMELILQLLCDSGYVVIADLSWKRLVFKSIKRLETGCHKRFIDELKILISRNRLVTDELFLSETFEHLAGDEKLDKWEIIFRHMHEKRPLFRIISSDAKLNFISSVSEINPIKDLANSGARTALKNRAEVESILFTTLAYAQRANIIDPYFTLDSEDDKNRRSTRETFDLICNLLGKGRGTDHRPKKSEIIINTMFDNYHKRERDNTDPYRLKDYLSEQKEKFGHDVTIQLWNKFGSQGQEKERMHDRCIITDQGGVTVGAGFTLDDRHDTFWSIIDFNEAYKFLNKYKQNSSKFDLHAIVTSEFIDIF